MSLAALHLSGGTKVRVERRRWRSEQVGLEIAWQGEQYFVTTKGVLPVQDQVPFSAWPGVHNYPAAMISDIRPASPEVRDALRAALIDVGCPISHAATVAELATVERDDDGDWVCVLGTCVVADATSALDQLAEYLVDDNAERHDRTARGEAGYPPLWPTPERAQRRER